MIHGIRADLQQRLDFLLSRRMEVLQRQPEYVSLPRHEQLRSRRFAQVEIFKKFYQYTFRQLRTLHNSGVGADYTVAFHTTMVDVCLETMWAIVDDSYQTMCPRPNHKPAVVAVGGYGRGELNPFSDIDLLVICPEKICPYVNMVTNNLLYMIWDAGLMVSHSVRSIDECQQWLSDQTIKTALLESRFLCGSPDTWELFEKRVLHRIYHWETDKFIHIKINEQRQRHQKQSSSLYLLEPNVKEGVGGLRDIHACLWIARARYGGCSVEDLESYLEMGDIKKGRNFLWRVRNELHFVANRSQDILTFDNQEIIARKFGYRDDHQRNRFAVELFMHDYYKCTRRIQGATEEIIYQCTPPTFRRKVFGHLQVRQLADGFIQKGNEILAFCDDDFFRAAPQRILKLFSIAQRRSLQISPTLKRTVQKNLGVITPRLRQDHSMNMIFRSILKYPVNVSRTFRQMHDCGVLGRWVPEFGTLDCLVQFDRYHVYTADEHTLRAVEHLEECLRIGYLSDESVFYRAISYARRRKILYLALLLHDVGKGKGGDHCNRGAIMAAQVCSRMGLDAGKSDLVQFLVRNHVFMANISQRRDISDPRTIEIFCQEVKSLERLAMLYLVTCCDIKAVGPKVWTDWKGQLLEDLFVAAEHYLMTGNTELYDQQEIEDIRQRLLGSGIDADALEIFDDDYLQLFSDGDVGQHARMIHQLLTSDETLLVAHKLQAESLTADIIVAGYDIPGIFSKIAGAILVHDLEIISSRINTLQNGMILDVITVYYREREFGEDPTFWDVIKTSLRRVLQGEDQLELERSWTHRRTISRRNLDRIFIHNDQSQNCTVVEVFAEDKPGLLYRITRALHDLKLNIHSASVTTKIEQVVDVFYVTDLDGNKVLSDKAIDSIKKKIGSLL
ncbi:[protein-PII] uridylyltransferase [Desulfurispira natronophila]|uniref:Bifunctional uridylyltransferase/uridylyl-removing enzyme n=1 Tax=Desulfurispira natronophila TaxID=682562 RepID=A0A7W8DHV2_9BACT|nr:[protein-PII] uridylyltransferase [Desulfurispira natronophila]MBB5022683.1 [protein-PII] uridylyltransferase [Desulfurispira natronophila]